MRSQPEEIQAISDNSSGFFREFIAWYFLKDLYMMTSASCFLLLVIQANCKVLESNVSQIYFQVNLINISSRGVFETHSTSSIKLFAKIVNGFQSLNIFPKSFIVDVGLGSKYASIFTADLRWSFKCSVENSILYV